MSYTPTPDDVAKARAYNERKGTDTRDEMLRRSKDSARMLPHWDRVDAILDGIEGMRAAGSDYLPRFADEADQDYRVRLSLTEMTNVYEDIVESLADKPFERPVTPNDEQQPEWFEKFGTDVDGANNNLTMFSAAAFFSGINSGIHWIFVDYPKRDTGETLSVAEANRLGLRPYWSHIIGRNVLEVKSKIINGAEVITYFRVLEPGDPDNVRVFERSDDGVVSWTLYEDGGKFDHEAKTSFVKIDEGLMSNMSVIPMIPFITGRREGRSWYIKPPMRSVAEAQVELYQQESGLKFAKTLTAYPMLAANGIAPPKDAEGNPNYKIAVGPNRVLWAKPGEGGRIGNWTYVEPNSESLKFLAADIKDAIGELRELGRQPLTAQSGNITVITAMVAAVKAESAVKAWALSLKASLDNALAVTGKLFGDKAYVADVNVFVEFDDYMQGDDLDALDKARARDDISRETYWEELKRRGTLSANFTALRESERLTGEGPSDPETITEG